MDNQSKKNSFVWIKRAGAIVFWLLLWQLVVMLMDKKSGNSMGGNLLVASPLETAKTLVLLVQTADFWKAVGHSFAKISSGFFLALVVGGVCAIFASVFNMVRALIDPLLRLIKAVPVASFIILALFWLSSSRNLSVLISFLMVLPVVYTNVLQGIESTDKELLEMASVFRVSVGKRIRYIYIPAVMPYFVSACSVGLGFCFKSGIAAEIIGLPNGSIGEKLYEAKLYLLTEDLFAWTAVIVFVSVIFEKVVMLFIKALAKGLTGSVKDSEQGEVSGNESGNSTFREHDTFVGNTDTPTDEVIPMTLKKSFGRSRDAGILTREGFGLRNVTKRFEENTVLEEFSLMIAPAETVALMGSSGCGKSTVGKLMLGLLNVDGGEVKRPKHMGAVFQEDRLCKEFDAITNIAMVTGNRREAQAALDAVGLIDVKGKPVAMLSGGMKRRVAIVRALLSDGEVLVLDEPFTGLDEDCKQQVLCYMKEKLQNRSALLITHNKDEAEALANRTIEMVSQIRNG